LPVKSIQSYGFITLNEALTATGVSPNDDAPIYVYTLPFIIYAGITAMEVQWFCSLPGAASNATNGGSGVHVYGGVLQIDEDFNVWGSCDYNNSLVGQDVATLTVDPLAINSLQYTMVAATQTIHYPHTYSDIITSLWWPVPLSLMSPRLIFLVPIIMLVVAVGIIH
jgi:hypothetical protein